MRALMALVIGMGVLIVIGLGLLGYGVYLRLNDEPAPPAAEAVAPPATAPPVMRAPPAPDASPPLAPFAASLGLPPGSSVKSLAQAGGRLAVAVILPGGEERILLLDPANGNVVGTIALGTPPAR